MAVFPSICLRLSVGFSIVLSLWGGCSLKVYGQSLDHYVTASSGADNSVAEGLARLDRAVCLQQWAQAIDLTSGLIASEQVSTAYRQDLLNFRRRLQAWQTSLVPLSTQASCDRTLPLVLTLPAPAAPPPQPLDWNRALAELGNPRPIIQLDDSFEPTDNLIPPELTASSPEALARFATPIDTRDGFNVVGGSLNRQQQVYSFLARLGDQVSLEVDATRVYTGGSPQLFIFDQSGRLLTQRDSDGLQLPLQDVVMPKTDVYFVAVTAQGTTPVLNAQGLIVDWQTAGNASFDYTLTLTGVTPYQALMP